MNKVIEIGRLARDIDLSYTPQTQTAVGRFTLAVNRRKKEDGADFIRCKAWGKSAETLERYTRKGDRLAIVGRIETGSYPNRDGVTVYTNEVVVEEFEFLETKHVDKPAKTETAPPVHHQEQFDDLPDSFEQAEDDMPF
jgi:single-strand DNA-binding protein